MLTRNRRSKTPCMIRITSGAVNKMNSVRSLIEFLPNEAAVGFQLNPGFEPGFFLR